MFVRLRLRLVTLLLYLLLVAPQSVFGQAITGFVDCAVLDEDAGELTAFFGYINSTQSPIFHTAGSDQNFFLPPPTNRGQPELFQPGEHHRVFSVTFPADSQVVWFLVGEAIVANSEVPQCVDPVDHYQCYTVKEKSELDTQSVDLEDQFGSSIGVQVGKPRLLCAPVDKNGEGVISPSTHLVCYDIRSQPKARQDVLVENQFGVQILEIGRASLLCVPSTE